MIQYEPETILPSDYTGQTNSMHANSKSSTVNKNNV
jgi:hypothetical protein